MGQVVARALISLSKQAVELLKELALLQKFKCYLMQDFNGFLQMFSRNRNSMRLLGSLKNWNSSTLYQTDIFCSRCKRWLRLPSPLVSNAASKSRYVTLGREREHGWLAESVNYKQSEQTLPNPRGGASRGDESRTGVGAHRVGLPGDPPYREGRRRGAVHAQQHCHQSTPRCLTSSPAQEHVANSADALAMEDTAKPNEYLNSQTPVACPSRVKLKAGMPVMLLRNLDRNKKLCNGTRYEGGEGHRQRAAGVVRGRGGAARGAHLWISSPGAIL